MAILTWLKNFFSSIFRVKPYYGTGYTETTTIVPETTVISDSGDTIAESSEPETIETTRIPYIPQSSKLVVLLDNGHASCTPGKRSPDGQLREYEFNRDVVKRISEKLNAIGITNYIITPEVDIDVALSRRAERANEYCKEYGADKCLFISVHVNAAGNGTEWMNARGWSVWTTVGKTNSDAYADIFWEEMNKILPPLGMTMRKDTSDGDKDYESNFTVIYKTKCPAILTENLFMDNRTDKRFLMTNEGREAIAIGHVNAIVRINKILYQENIVQASIS